MVNKNKIIKKFSVCLAVKGYLRGIMYDINRSEYNFIPLAMCDYCDFIENKGVEALTQFENDSELSSAYFNYLMDNEYVFICDKEHEKQFPELQKYWDYPALVSNAIIEMPERYDDSICSMFDSLEELGCEYLLFYSKDILKTEEYEYVINNLQNRRFRQVEFIFKFSEYHDYDRIFNATAQLGRVKRVLFHSSPHVKEIKVNNNIPLFYCFKDSFADFIAPKVDIEYFNVRVNLFMEAQYFHTFFNRKLFINKDGLILKHLNSSVSLGSISLKNITSIINDSKDIKLYWNVKKDDTDICKVCEFRYMCIDSRVPIIRDNGSAFHETECNYNPFIAKWKGEVGYSNLQECGVCLSKEGMEIDENKLFLIQKKIYEDFEK